MQPVFLFFGTLFGYLLSRAGATTFDLHAHLFLFEDLQLLWVIAVAVTTGMIGLFIMKRLRLRSLMGNEPLTFEGKKMHRHLAGGALMLGIGWGLSGSVMGIVAGTYLCGLTRERAGMRHATTTWHYP